MNKDVMADSNCTQQALIDGATRLFAIIGDPIEQVKSPQTLNPRFVAAAGSNTVLIPVHVRPERFNETVKGLMAVGNLDGIIMTVPFKSRIMPLIDDVLPMATTVGAANAMRREARLGAGPATCSMGAALVRGLREAAIRPEGRARSC